VRKRWTGTAAVLLVVASLAVLATASGGSGATQSTRAVSGSISFDGIWTGAEAKSIQAVIDVFNKTYPNVHVSYKPVGDNLPTVVGTALAGGHPPDIADVAQPGLIQEWVNKKSLKPIEYARSEIGKNFQSAFEQLGVYNGKLYGIVFKPGNKSTVWYNVHAFKNAGVTAPATWPDFVKAGSTVKASGTTPFSIGGADGWTLTDLFENIYLRQAGPAKYVLLTKHKIPWTDSSVTAALTTMGQMLKGSLIAGGTSGAVQTDFPTSVNNVWQNPPKAAMVIEGDFVPGVATVKAKAGTDFGEFPFPSINGSSGSVVISGDSIVAFRDTPAIEAFVTFLATPAASEAWAKRGGFATANKNVSPSVYPDAVTRATASAIAAAKNVAFDMSDQQPGAFGATVGQGEWGLFQDFLRNPSDAKGIAKKLEASAASAYKKG
jgi:alpha-glucoside transport system substrate-binding protein